MSPHETPAFCDALQSSVSALTIQLREQAPERNASMGTNRGTAVREGIVAGHAKGFAQGWAAAIEAYGIRPARAVDVEAMAHEVCRPFDEAKALVPDPAGALLSRLEQGR